VEVIGNYFQAHGFHARIRRLRQQALDQHPANAAPSMGGMHKNRREVAGMANLTETAGYESGDGNQRGWLANECANKEVAIVNPF